MYGLEGYWDMEKLLWDGILILEGVCKVRKKKRKEKRLGEKEKSCCAFIVLSYDGVIVNSLVARAVLCTKTFPTN